MAAFAAGGVTGGAVKWEGRISEREGSDNWLGEDYT